MAVKGTLKSNGNEILIKQSQIEGLDNFNAATAQTATKAIQDGEGRNIYNTYATKEELTNATFGDINADETYLRLDGNNFDKNTSNIIANAIMPTTQLVGFDPDDNSVIDAIPLEEYFENDNQGLFTGNIKKAKKVSGENIELVEETILGSERNVAKTVTKGVYLCVIGGYASSGISKYFSTLITVFDTNIASTSTLMVAPKETNAEYFGVSYEPTTGGIFASGYTGGSSGNFSKVDIVSVKKIMDI